VCWWANTAIMFRTLLPKPWIRSFPNPLFYRSSRLSRGRRAQMEKNSRIRRGWGNFDKNLLLDGISRGKCLVRVANNILKWHNMLRLIATTILSTLFAIIRGHTWRNFTSTQIWYYKLFRHSERWG